MDVFAAAYHIGAHVETLRRLARKGNVPAYKVGKDWRFSRSALDRWRNSHQVRHRPALALIVDDERDMRGLIGVYLERDGYRIALAGSTEHAMELARREPPDVALVDLVMPRLSGADLVRDLRAMNAELPIVIVTGYPDSRLLAEAMRYPPVTLLPKPVKEEDLLRTVRLVLHGADRRPS